MARCEASGKPWVIAHRGACGSAPEHTLAAYRIGIEQGADFIEPDLVLTRDGAAIARHENELSGTTDVADRREFAGRRTERMVDGVVRTGWFSEDFALVEIRTLRARERLPALRPASAAQDGLHGIVTLDEVVALAAAHGVGLVLELKHAAHFAARGLRFEDVLPRFGRGDAVFVESFEPAILRTLRAMSDVRLVQLLEADAVPDLASIAGYADAIGAAKALIVPRGADCASLAPTDLVARAHGAGLLVFAWTFRSENVFLPAELRRGDDPSAHGDAGAEYRQFYALGVDAVFSDFPGEAVAARNSWGSNRPPPPRSSRACRRTFLLTFRSRKDRPSTGSG